MCLASGVSGQGHWWAIHGATLAEGTKRAWIKDANRENRNVQRRGERLCQFCARELVAIGVIFSIASTLDVCVVPAATVGVRGRIV